MKKLYTLFIFVLCCVSVNAQITWDVIPVSHTIECDDNNNDQDILDYIATITASEPNCANPPNVTTDYSDPGSWDCGDVITIEFVAEDDCGVEPDLITAIDITIDDTTAPTIDDSAEDEVVECGPNNSAELMTWINNHADATFDDDCTDDADFTWFSNPDPVTLADLVMDCSANDGEVTVDFWVEDECGNSSNATTATFTVEDTTDPSFDDANGVWDITFECDGMGNLTDLQTWVADIMSNIAVSDNCTDVATLVASLTNDFLDIGFPFCNGPDMDVTFEITDECGNVSEYVATASLEDNFDPIVSTDASDLILVCDPATNGDDIQVWLDAVGNSIFADDCTQDGSLLMIDNDYSGTPPDCDDGFETVTFTIEDLCGNTVETSADIIIDDFDPPSIVLIETAPPSLECDFEAIVDGQIQDLLDGVIASALAEDFNGCTDPADLIWHQAPDPAPDQATTPDPNCAGSMAGLYEIDVWVEDECGNLSPIETVVFTVEDTQNPITPSNLPESEDFECITDVPDAPELWTPDICEGMPAIFDEVVDDSDPCNVTIERTWIFEDACGNVSETHEQTIVVSDSEGPEWLGDEDDYLPEDIDIVVANCDDGFTFPNGYFENEAEEEAWPIFPLMEGSEFEDNCGAIFTILGPPPTEEFGEGCTPIEYIVEDECGNQLTHSFEVCIICANCAGGGVYCNFSCETEPACHTCNIEELLDGFESCTPEWTGGLEPWPPSLCNGAGVPHNISWFSFVAGGTDLCVEVSPFMCAQGSGSIGLQSGVYDFCEDDGGECIGGDAFCSSGLDPISYGLSDLIVGNTYYLFVDGCNGAECDYEITIEKGLEFILDTPEEVVAVPDCEQAPGFPPNTFCPQTILQFDIWHEGDSPSDNGEYDSPGPYNPELSAEFFWTFNPPIEGMSDGSWSTGEDGDGFNIPPLSFDYVTTTTVFEICLTEIVAECSDVECDDCCLEITIMPLPPEHYGPYEVCVEDLLEATGWDPGQVGDDPNGDGIEWIGPTNITYDQVLDAINMNNGILEFEVFDPECGCPFMQTLEIIPIGNLEPVEVTLYMFDCQFRDEDGDLDSYDWEWPDDIYELNVDMEDFFFRIAEGSLDRDWENEKCDSLLLVTVDTAIVFGALSQGPCTPTGTEYCFELNLDLLEDNHDEHPIVMPDYIDMKWVDENGTTFGTGPCITVMSGEEGIYTVELEYSFIDGAYEESLLIIDECTKEFGPFDLDTGIAAPPTIDGEDTFCENDLTDKSFFVTITGEGTTYEWTFPTGAVGVVHNAPENDSVVVDFTNYDFVANEPLIVVANTPCGQSPPVEVFVTALPLPTPDFDLVTPVCVGDLANAVFNGDATEISEFIWSSGNYTSGNQSGAGPVSYSSATPGSYDVSLVVIDNNGCESEPVTHSFEVIEPLPAPNLDCSTTASSISFSWDPIVGATGYVINVIDAPTMMGPFNNDASTTFIDFTGLSVNDIISIEVYATGDAPCGDGPAAPIECQALDCPDPLWEFNLWQDTSFCINDPIADFAYDVSGPDGSASYISSAAGAVDASGNVTVSALPEGLHTVTMTYTYQNGDCMRSRTVEIEVFPEPSADFVPSDLELCLGEFITIDDTNVDDVAIWDYGVDGRINANGEVSWTSPGDKTIIVNVTTPELLGSCTNSSQIVVSVFDTLTMGEISCIDMDLDFVHFDWDDVANATGYDISYTVNGGTAQTSTITDSEILITPLMPNDIVAITVTALSPNICNDVTRTAECEAIGCTPLDFDNPICSDAGIDYVYFEWDEVEGASMFEVLINGMLVGTQDSTSFLVTGLSPGDNVFIEVIALNDLTQCQDVARTEDCTAIDCPDVTMVFTNIDDPCYTASIGGIQLVDPEIQNAMGGGTGAWDSPYVDASGVFTPDADNDMIYMLDYTYVEGQCSYTETMEVEIIIIPEGAIDVSDDDICITETTVVEAPVSTSNGETAIWDWGQGVNAFGTGFGPYDVRFDSPGTYVITLTVDNDGCLSEPVTATIEVDEELTTPDVDCSSTNSYIIWDWDDVEYVTQYSISVDGAFQTTQTNSDFRVDGLMEDQTVELTISFLTDSSCSLPDLVVPCVTTACPASFFVLDDYVTEMCLDGTQESQQLNIELMNTPSDPGVATWTGPGVSNTGFFNPSGLSGQTVELNYEVVFAECSYDTTIVIDLFDAPQITAINPINPDCFLDNIGGINPEVEGGTPGYTYMVDNLAPQDFPAFVDVINPGLHNLLVTDANGCTSQLNFEILAAQEPALDINGPLSILNTETGEYTFSTTAQNIGDVVWLANGEVICQGTDCNPVEILGDNYPDDFDLTVQIIFNEDCFIETTIRVDVFEIQKYYIPNVISEGANPPNNHWYMYTKGGDILVRSVKIYDRWGELVHDAEINTYDNEVDLLWDGTWTNETREEVVIGVYVYLIELEVEGRQVIEAGDISVIR